ncbi:collagen alpha-1(I) chain-like [Melospiza georgiana]|uniref:collagen alpha-1(I) chain-like n=1 Tax=Melospiza georgiana TaxID=44398 RepID=UPI0025AC8A3F|nr:collagen alpha-1(I) chain-like [Melospiza georgiana]
MRGRAPGFDRTSTQRNGRGKKIGEAHAPKDRQEAGEPAPPTASPREGRCRPHMPSFGGGPGARARPGLRAEGHAARAGHAGGTAARPLSLSRDDAHTYTHGSGHTRPGARPSAPAHAGSPSAPFTAGLAARRRAAARRHATTAVPPARLPARRDRSRRAGQRPGGRAPPPGPEADATETRSSVASARGLPDGRPRRRQGRTPGAAAAASHRRGPLPRHAPGGRRTALSRGATPALLVFTRRPGGGSAPAAARTPSYGPHAAGKGDGGRDVQGPGRDRRRRRRAPSGRPSPLGGTPVERRRRRSARGRPRSRASADGGPARRSPPGRAGDRAGRGTAGGRRRRCVRGGKAAEGRGAGRAGRGAARARDRGKRAEERARQAPAAATPRPRKGRERALSAGVARYDEASGSAPAADRATRPLRRGRAAERGGQGAPPRRGAVTPALARGGDDDDDDRDGGSAAGGRGHHRRGSAGVAAPHPSVAPHRRPATTTAAAAAAAGTAAATAGRAEPPESLNRRPARRPPFGTPAAAFGDAEGGNLGGEPPRRGALGTWPWGEGNDLHGPAGVPPPLPPSGERPPAGARPPSAATTAASFSGTAAARAAPPARGRGPTAERAAPARARGPKRGPERPEGSALGRARGTARPESGSSADVAKPRSPVREGPEEPPPPSPEGAPATRSLTISTSAADGCHGRTAGRRSTGEAARGGTGAPPGGAVPSTPPSRHPGGFLARSEESRPRENSGRRQRGARTRHPATGVRRRRPRWAGGSGPAAAPLPGGDGPAADRRKAGGRRRRRRRRRRKAAATAARHAALRGPAATRGVARGQPRPRARVPRASVTLSGAAARGLDGKGVWPPWCRPRPAGRGAERSNGAGVRATPRARPAGRPGNAAGAEPHR